MFPTTISYFAGNILLNNVRSIKILRIILYFCK